MRLRPARHPALSVAPDPVRAASPAASLLLLVVAATLDGVAPAMKPARLTTGGQAHIVSNRGRTPCPPPDRWVSQLGSAGWRRRAARLRWAGARRRRPL